MNYFWFFFLDNAVEFKSIGFYNIAFLVYLHQFKWHKAEKKKLSQFIKLFA